ncbi:AI-2E family transporter [Campylobacter pinnipediorum subsp. pinnipediorum]|uniref:AI-2E family transporter n=1 Tax=Campylobacter pinnipediorum subsp. pinnipediorum TaxID=1660067 RepID=A0AAX0L9M4_9BACT|nr:AI-2E family transporter [Campylobacter pinnipediorum subsp. pinnipediorum]
MINNGRVYVGFFVIFSLCLVLYLFKPFLLNIFIAALLAVATSNINVKLLQITNNKKTLSAFLTTVALFSLFMAPFLYAVVSVAKYAANIDINTINTTVDYLKNYDFNLPKSFEFLTPKIKEIISSIDVKFLFNTVVSNIANVGKLSARFMIDMVFILVFFFFCILYGSELIGYIKKALPMNIKDSEFVLSEVANVMSVVFYSIIINTIFQGCLFAFITSIYGYDGFLTGILFGFSSLIPVIGGLLLWLPISLYEFANLNTTAAIVIALYTIIVISIIADTFLKPLIIKFINSKLVKIPTKINELLLFFSMIAGISTFGFWGLILGPAIVTFFISNIKLYTLIKRKFID